MMTSTVLRRWRLGWCVLWAHVLMAVTVHAQTAQPLMQAQQVTPQVYYVQGASEMGSSANQNFISNAGFVVTPAGVVVIDALGSPELARRLIAQIRKVTPKPLNTVIVTHYHADHVYGLQQPLLRFAGLAAAKIQHADRLGHARGPHG